LPRGPPQVFEPVGFVLITLAIFIDGGLGPTQERCMNECGSRKSEMLCYTYAGAFFINFLACLASGDAAAAVAFLEEMRAAKGAAAPAAAVAQVVLLALIGFGGVSAVLQIVKEFGAVVAIVAATTRKAFTIGDALCRSPAPSAWPRQSSPIPALHPPHKHPAT
jgi:adenosine 3'-phospho 5'-phosphosulfate transporter B3